MHALKIFRILCFIFIIKTNGQIHNWERTNPGGGGWFSCIGASKSGIILAGSDLSGAYRSKDGGYTWDVCGASRGLSGTHISGMGFHKKNGNILFLGNDGISKSEDGGDSWKHVLVSEGVNRGYVTDIEFATDKPWIGYASWHGGNWNTTNAKIYKTTNTGNTWIPVSKNLPPLRIIKMVVNPKNANIVYLLSGSGRPVCSVADVYKSTNGGLNWVNITASNNFEGFTEIADFNLDPNNPDTLYITTVKANCNNKFWIEGLDSKFYKSTNGGNTWTKKQDHGGVILLNPVNSNITLINLRATATWNDRSGTRLSTNGGNTFSKISDVSKWDTTFHGNLQGTYGGTKDGYGRAIGVDLSNPDNFYSFTNQWITGSKDGGRNFQILHANKTSPNNWQSTGVDNLVNVDMVISPANPNIIYLGLADMGIWRSLNKGKSWENCNTDDGKYGWGDRKGGDFHSVVADPTRDNVVWATCKEGYILKSKNKGASSSWKEVSTGIESNSYVNGLSIDVKSPVNNRTLFSTANGSVYKSINDGVLWTKVLNNKFCQFTAVDKFNGNIVYAGGSKGLWRSLNGGENWSRLQLNDLPADSDELSIRSNNYIGVFDIDTDPNNPDWVYVTVYGKGVNKGLYRSKNKGNSWEKLLSDAYMRKVAIMPKNSNVLYATSSSAQGSGGLKTGSNGVWFSKDGGKNWSKQIKGMAYPFGNAVDISNEQNPYVMVGSQGTGFQKFDVPISGITANAATLFEHCNYTGNKKSFGVGQYPNINNVGFTNDDLSSVELQEGYKITLYSNYNFTGNSIVLTTENSCLISDGFNDSTSSFKIEEHQGRIQINGTFIIKNATNKQNIIAPSWDNHNARMYDASTIFSDHKWEFKHLGNNIHTIRNIGTNRFLEVAFAKCENNANANTWTSANANHQKWYIEKRGNLYFFNPLHCSNMSLDKSTGNNGNVKLWPSNYSNNNQQFLLLPESNRLGEDLVDFNEINIYPNPVKDKITVDFSNHYNKQISYKIYDISGKVVKQSDFNLNGSKTNRISLNRLTKGFYFLKIWFSKDKIVTKKITKL